MKHRKFLVGLRKQRDWLQKDVVKKLSDIYGINITVSYYGMIEQGVRTPGLELALAISALFEEPAQKLFFSRYEQQNVVFCFNSGASIVNLI